MTLLTDFFHSHRLHGPLTGHATKPAWNGYLVTVACPCSVTFVPWVALVDAATELGPSGLRVATLN